MTTPRQPSRPKPAPPPAGKVVAGMVGAIALGLLLPYLMATGSAAKGLASSTAALIVSVAWFAGLACEVGRFVWKRSRGRLPALRVGRSRRPTVAFVGPATLVVAVLAVIHTPARFVVWGLLSGYVTAVGVIGLLRVGNAMRHGTPISGVRASTRRPQLTQPTEHDPSV